MTRVAAIKHLGARVRQSWRVLLKEASAFGVVGAVCLVVDLGSFQLLYAHAGVGAVTSKLLATIVSVTLAYFGHRYWSFSHRARTGLKREYSLFFLVNGLTLLLGLAMVAVVRYPLGQDDALALQVTNIASICLGTLIRYVCYRRFIFVAEDAPAAVAHRENLVRRAAEGPEPERSAA
jgi:putative flippase GtrA